MIQNNLYMNIIIKTKNFELTDAIRSFVNEKVGALGRFESKITEAQIDLERMPRHNSGDIFCAEIMFYVPQDLLRAGEKANDLYAAIDGALQKSKLQLEKYHSRKKGMMRKTRRIRRALKAIPEYFGYALEEPLAEIVKRKNLTIEKSMFDEEAIAEMKRLKHSFFVFRQTETNKLCVLYKRDQDGYGIIEIT